MMHRILSVLRGGVAQSFLLLALGAFAGIPAAHAATIQDIQLSPFDINVNSDITVPFTVHALDENGVATDVTSEAIFSENDPFCTFSENIYFS